MAFTGSLLPVMHQRKPISGRGGEKGKTKSSLFACVFLPVYPGKQVPAKPYGLLRPTKRALPPSSGNATALTHATTRQMKRPTAKYSGLNLCYHICTVTMSDTRGPEEVISTPEAFLLQSLGAPTTIARLAPTTPMRHQIPRPTMQRAKLEHGLGNPRTPKARRTGHAPCPKAYTKRGRTPLDPESLPVPIDPTRC